MTTFYFYFNKSDLSLQRVTDNPNTILENTFRMDHDLNSIDDLPSGWKSNSTILMRILRAYRNILIEETIWVFQRHQTETVATLTGGQYDAWKTYWQTLRTLPATVDLTGVTLDTLINEFPVQPAVE